MRLFLICLLFFIGSCISSSLFAQTPYSSGKEVPPEVEEMYKKGLLYLVSIQNSEGNFGNAEPGVIGLCIIAFLAHGEDPNHGPYADTIKKAINCLVTNQRTDGYMGNSMYNHGFATLALAEAYGMVDDRRIGSALKKAVDLITKSQAENPYAAWRYSPDSKDADTTVSGCCFVALAAAANAGLKIPDDSLKRALTYLKNCQADDGGIGYTGQEGSGNPTRTAIAALCYTLAKDKESLTYKKCIRFIENSGNVDTGYYQYYLYYMAQATFHCNETMWNEFNVQNIATLRTFQNQNGSWSGDQGIPFSTAASLLSLALNYRYLPIYER